MKIVIVGCGKVGRNIAKDLASAGHNLVIVDKDEKIVNEVSNSLDVLGVVGEAISMETLNDAGVGNSDLLLAVTSSDEANMLCCLFARKANKDLQTIARVRNPIYSKEIKYIKSDLGLSLIINPEMATAREIARILRFPNAMKVEHFSRGRVELVSFSVPKGNMLVDREIRDIAKELNIDLLFAGIERKDEAIIPNGLTKIMEDDVVSIVARPQEVTAFFSKIGLLVNPVKSCMIVGGSTISYYLAKLLIKAKVAVTVIEKDLERCEELSDLLPEATIINGDASDDSVLLEEGIKEVDAFISLTNLDEENILISLYARKSSKAQVITKINHIEIDSVVNSLDLGTLVDPKGITSDNIISYVRAILNASGSYVDELYRIMNDKAEVISFNVNKDSKIINVPFEELHLKKNLLIGSIIRDDNVITPSGKDSIQVGDQVLVVTTNIGLEDIEEIVE